MCFLVFGNVRQRTVLGSMLFVIILFPLYLFSILEFLFC